MMAATASSRRGAAAGRGVDARHAARPDDGELRANRRAATRLPELDEEVRAGGCAGPRRRRAHGEDGSRSPGRTTGEACLATYVTGLSYARPPLDAAHRLRAVPDDRRKDATEAVLVPKIAAAAERSFKGVAFAVDVLPTEWHAGIARAEQLYRRHRPIDRVAFRRLGTGARVRDRNAGAQPVRGVARRFRRLRRARSTKAARRTSALACR